MKILERITKAKREQKKKDMDILYQLLADAKKRRLNRHINVTLLRAITAIKLGTAKSLKVIAANEHRDKLDKYEAAGGEIGDPYDDD